MLLCEQHVLINIQRAEDEWSCKNACMRGEKKNLSKQDAQRWRKCKSAVATCLTAQQWILFTPSSRHPANVIPLSLNYYLLALPLAPLASPLASSVPFIAFLNNFYKWGEVFSAANVRAAPARTYAWTRRSAFTHQSLIEARVLVFLNRAHLKNVDANYFALFMHSPSPCRFKHFRGHLDSSNYLGLSRLSHE